MTLEVERDPPAEEVVTLLREYADSLGFSLDFQDFDGELERLPEPYARPSGALLLARVDQEPAGCVALRRLDVNAGELKRLYVRPAHRGLGLGRLLTETAIGVAQELGYPALRLDTIPTMIAAQGLYRALGFREIAPYRHNPIAGVRYLELTLSEPRAR
jgi:putative acetyltransferase